MRSSGSGRSLATTIVLPPSEPSKRPGGAIDGDVLEHLAERGHLGAQEPERLLVDDVLGVDAVVAQDALDVADELGRREVPRHGATAEGVADDEIGGVGGDVGEVDAGIAGDDAEVVVEDEAELLFGDVDDAGVELEHRGSSSRGG